MKPSRQIWPKSELGNWSMALAVAMMVFFLVGTSLTELLYSEVSSGETIWADVKARPALSLSMLVGMTAGIAAYIVGLLALTIRKDRAITVFISTALGALLLILLGGEFIFPH